MTIQRIKPGPRMSGAVVHGNTVYLAGHTGADANGKVAEGIRAQTVQVLENVKTALAFAGGGFELASVGCGWRACDRVGGAVQCFVLLNGRKSLVRRANVFGREFASDPVAS